MSPASCCCARLLRFFTEEDATEQLYTGHLRVVLTTPDFEEDFRARGEEIVASVPTDVTPSAERVALGRRIAGKMTYVAERDCKQCERKARTKKA